MRDIFKIKNILMTPLIRVIIKHPKIMEFKLFLKAMTVFPEKVSRTYDEKIASSHQITTEKWIGIRETEKFK